MPEQDPKIKELEDRLDALVRTQIDFQKEITAIRGELVRLHARRLVIEEKRTEVSFYTPPSQPGTPPAAEPPKPDVVPPSPRPDPPPVHTTSPSTQPPPRPRPPVARTSESSGYELPKRTAYVADPVLSSATTSGGAFSRFISQYTENARANLEKFIGENLISLIGIVVLILGVGIGAKYAIDNNLISPLTRIIIGYIFGFGLVGLAIKLRTKYEAFSSVLFSGGMAIMYFVTYFAYSAYSLLSQPAAFGLMIMFTVFTVAAALFYNRQVIAHIGLVGAYAVPFLLSNDSGNYLALFVYMAIVNTGILAISVKKDWKPVFYTSSLFTWVIFCGWYSTKYSSEQHFNLALIFLAVFFLIFFVTKLVQTRFLQDSESRENILSTLGTTVIFYAMCFAITMSAHHDLARYWILFTYFAAAAVLMSAVTLSMFKQPFILLASWVFTWATLFGWFVSEYSHQEHFALVLSFVAAFFVIFYGTALLRSRSSVNDESDAVINLGLSLLSGAALFGMGVAILITGLLDPKGYWTLFSYLAAASVLMLATSFKIYGRTFMYLVVPFMWAIYGLWFATHFDSQQHFQIAVVFPSLFFAIFYVSVLFHRLVEDNFTLVEHTSLVLSNAFIFFGFGYALMDRYPVLSQYLGLYTAANAALHLLVAFAVKSFSPKSVDVVQVLTILVLTFSSIAIPVQFEGNVVTMVWAAEGAMLFWFGRTRGVRLFERFSYPVMFLATAKIFLDWGATYYERTSGNGSPLVPFANADFITAIVFVVAFASIYITNRDRRHEPGLDEDLVRPFGLVIAAIGTFVLYNMFRTEIGNYFYLSTVRSGLFERSVLSGAVGDLELFDVVWQVNYTIVFLIAMAALNLKRLRSPSLAAVNCVFSVLTLALFATLSLFIFYELRQAFMLDRFRPDFISHWMYIGIRPISYILAAGLLYLLYEYSRDSLLERRIKDDVLAYAYDALLFSFGFVVASCELVNLMGQFYIPDATKLGLSILWGVYALMLIVIGIARHKKHLRMAAFGLLAVTLVKLFFYDIADLDTIPKTILFVTLGITLLVVSFLYNKYMDVIFTRDLREDE